MLRVDVGLVAYTGYRRRRSVKHLQLAEQLRRLGGRGIEIDPEQQAAPAARRAVYAVCPLGGVLVGAWRHVALRCGELTTQYLAHLRGGEKRTWIRPGLCRMPRQRKCSRN